jgi:hypothetical protein
MSAGEWFGEDDFSEGRPYWLKTGVCPWHYSTESEWLKGWCSWCSWCSKLRSEASPSPLAKSCFSPVAIITSWRLSCQNPVLICLQPLSLSLGSNSQSQRLHHTSMTSRHTFATTLITRPDSGSNHSISLPACDHAAANDSNSIHPSSAISIPPRPPNA